jgi:hypothetical protein
VQPQEIPPRPRRRLKPNPIPKTAGLSKPSGGKR